MRIESRTYDKINTYEFFLGLILLTLPVSIGVNSIIIIVSAIYFLYIGLSNISRNTIKIFYYSFLFFGIQLLSFFLSTNSVEANKKIILFLPFLVFPLCFMSILNKDKISIAKVFDYLLYGILLILLYGGIRFGYDVLFLDERYDYGYGLSLLLRYVPHHVYLSLFILICLFSISIGVAKKEIGRNRLIFLPILYVTIFLLASRMALLIAIFIIPAITFYVLKERFERRKLILIIGIFFVFLFGIGLSIDFTRDKMVYAYYDIFGIVTKEKPFLGVTFRKQVWESSLFALKEAPFFGYGIGDVQDILNSAYNKRGYPNIIGMNAHNQFIQCLLAYGIVPSLLLLFVCISIVWKCILKRQFLLLYMSFLLLTFCLTESILNRQWGVVIFAFILNASIYELYKIRNQDDKPLGL